MGPNMTPSSTRIATEDGFREYRLLLLKEIERLNESTDELKDCLSQKDKKIDLLERRVEDDLKKHGEAIAALKVQCSIWGGVVGCIGGVLTAMGTILMYYIKSKF